MNGDPEQKSKGMKLPTKILLGLVIGAVVGVVFNRVLGPTHPTIVSLNDNVAGPIGQVFLRMLFMIVIPLVFSSIALGVAGLGDVRKIGRVGGKTLGFFLATTLLSATLGILLVLAIRPGSRVDPAVRDQLMVTYSTDASARVEAAVAGGVDINTLVNIVTRNPVKSAVDMDLLGVIFFGLIFGAAVTLSRRETVEPMIGFLTALQEIVIKIVHMAMLLAPIGVAALIFGVTSRFGFDLLRPLAVYVATVLVALFIHGAFTMSGIVKFVIGLSPATFYKRIWAAMVTAFSTSSSAATLPTNIAVSQQNLGVPSHVAGFVLPLGNTMCMNGTSLFEGITVLFLAQVFGVALTLPQMIVVVGMCVITAVGAAGVPGGSIPLLVGILINFGVPGEGIALILGIDRILDMSRTVVNIIGDHAATLFIARSEGVWTPASVPNMEPGVSAAALDDSPGWPT
jgi:DAACS family dicarboxylate/amino acid:cation (Na+ or H+) symporter